MTLRLLALTDALWLRLRAVCRGEQRAATDGAVGQAQTAIPLRMLGVISASFSGTVAGSGACVFVVARKGTA